jgi:hypothetical protein
MATKKKSEPSERRRTNGQLVDDFAKLLTEGAKEVMSAAQLTKTKEWRGKLWKELMEIERRLCPRPGDNEGEM